MMKRVLCIFGALIAVFALLILPIGAEVTPPTPPTFDSSTIYDYPGANLVPYPYTSFSDSSVVELNGLTFTLEDYGIIVSGGTASASTIFSLGNIVLPAGTYTISGSSPPLNFYAQVYVDGEYQGSYANTTFTIEGRAGVNLYLYIGEGNTAGGTIYPMLTVGTSSYPYQPYLPYYFQQAFNAGWNQSYDQAYYAGQADAFDVLNGSTISILTQATYSAILSFESGPAVRIDFTPNFTYDGVFFKSLLTQIESRSDFESIDRVTLVLTWDEDHTFSFADTPIYLSGNTLFTDGRVYDFSGNAYSVYGDPSVSKPWKLELDDSVSGTVLVNSLQLFVGRPGDLLNEIYVSTSSGSYNRGYDVGYAAGFNTGLNKTQDELRQEYYDSGYKNGFSVGKAEGLSISETGTWRDLFTSVVEAPVNTFQSLFNFEILGLDMRAAFGSVLALCVVLIIVKKVIL